MRFNFYPVKPRVVLTTTAVMMVMCMHQAQAALLAEARDFDRLAETSSAAVWGTVLGRRAVEIGGRIYTENQVRLDGSTGNNAVVQAMTSTEVPLPMNSSVTRVCIRTAGGELGPFKTVLPGEVQLSVGTRLMAFIEGVSEGCGVPNSLALGVYKVVVPLMNRGGRQAAPVAPGTERLERDLSNIEFVKSETNQRGLERMKQGDPATLGDAIRRATSLFNKRNSRKVGG